MWKGAGKAIENMNKPNPNKPKFNLFGFGAKEEVKQEPPKPLPKPKEALLEEDSPSKESVPLDPDLGERYKASLDTVDE